MKYFIYALLLTMASGYCTTPIIASTTQQATPAERRAKLQEQIDNINDLLKAAKKAKNFKEQNRLESQIEGMKKQLKAIK